MLQGFARQLRASGGELLTGERVARIERVGGRWHVRTESGADFCAPVIVNAAGAWADAVAKLAGARPIGLQPKRRTIITFDAPPDVPLDGLPFAKTVGDELYFAPESGRLFACPMDEVPSAPCDAQPDEYEMALAAERMEDRTIVQVKRIHSRWAGLRSFAPDNHPVVGFDPQIEGFFWLAGQGGAGLQTSPAMSRIAAALLLGRTWPLPDVRAEALDPARFLGQSA
jgi:D-arginine dehydrogenase